MSQNPHHAKLTQRSFASKLPIHYGWIIMVCGTLCIFACLGLGRFSLGMLLPSMGTSLGLSYSEMGIISTANFMGYLAAVLISAKLMAMLGARVLISLSLLLVGISMILISKASSMGTITTLYIITGMGSAMANVPVMALISIWFGQKTRGKAAGFVVIGSGLAILLSGKLLPYLNSLQHEGWRLSWLILGILVLVSAAVCYSIFRNKPENLGLHPVGGETKEQKQQESPQEKQLAVTSKIVLHCGAIYFLFGFTYVIYVTFVVTAMIQDHGYAEAAAGTFWSWIGLLSLISGPIPGAFSDKFGRKAALITVFSIQAVAYLCLGLPLPDFFLFISIGCFGIVAWAIPSIITALVADYAGQQRVAAIFGFVTFIFGIGQISGPFLAGLLAEKTGSFSSSFLLAFVFAAFAVILSMMLPTKSR